MGSVIYSAAMSILEPRWVGCVLYTLVCETKVTFWSIQSIPHSWASEHLDISDVYECKSLQRKQRPLTNIVMYHWHGQTVPPQSNMPMYPGQKINMIHGGYGGGSRVQTIVWTGLKPGMDHNVLENNVVPWKCIHQHEIFRGTIAVTEEAGIRTCGPCCFSTAHVWVSIEGDGHTRTFRTMLSVIVRLAWS